MSDILSRWKLWLAEQGKHVPQTEASAWAKFNGEVTKNFQRAASAAKRKLKSRKRRSVENASRKANRRRS